VEMTPSYKAKVTGRMEIKKTPKQGEQHLKTQAASSLGCQGRGEHAGLEGIERGSSAWRKQD